MEVTGGQGRYVVTVGEQVWEVDARRTPHGVYSLLIDGVSHAVEVENSEGGPLVVHVAGERHEVQVEEEIRHLIRTRAGGGARAGGQTLTAPLPGKITHVAVSPGDAVTPGATLVVIEAMKMENEFRASVAGTVTEVQVAPGQAVNPGDVLVVIG